VVDVYDGNVELYVMQPDEPVLRLYRSAFPGIFRPLPEMPASLRAHLRYPEDLFRIQVEKYSRYHMTIPRVFYNNEDLWTPPREKYAGDPTPMQPYYILMRLPEEQRLKFLLMLPLTPRNRDNMIAWIAARCDRPDYGRLLVYKLPKEKLILGPMQIEALIDQDPVSSRRLSLWDQRGSRVIRGNLLVIPMDHSFLYVEPVYLIAEVQHQPARILHFGEEILAVTPHAAEAAPLRFSFSRLDEMPSSRSSPSISTPEISRCRAVDWKYRLKTSTSGSSGTVLFLSSELQSPSLDQLPRQQGKSPRQQNEGPADAVRHGEPQKRPQGGHPEGQGQHGQADGQSHPDEGVAGDFVPEQLRVLLAHVEHMDQPRQGQGEEGDGHRLRGGHVEPEQGRREAAEVAIENLQRQQGQRGAAHGRQADDEDFAGVAREQKVDELADVAEDDPAVKDGGDDAGEGIVLKHHVGSLPGHLGASLAHGDADVRLLQGRGVVDAVARHGDDGAAALVQGNEVEFALGPDPGEDGGLQQFFALIPVQSIQAFQGIAPADLHLPFGQLQRMGHRLGRGGMVPGDHDDPDARLAAALKRLPDLLSGRIPEPGQADQPDAVARLVLFRIGALCGQRQHPQPLFGHLAVAILPGAAPRLFP